MKKALVIHPSDNVANALEDISVGDEVEAGLGKKTEKLTAKDAVPYGFKIALRNIPKGDAVVKYGEVIGKSNALIPKGSLVHIHNVEGNKGRGDLIKGGVKQ